MAPADYAGVVSNCSIGQWPEVLLREEGSPDAAKTTGHYPLGHNLRTKLRTRSTKVSLEGAAGFGAFAAAAGVDAGAGAGVFANVTWVQRVNTSGGVGPAGSCDPALAGADGGVLKVPYTADYFFYTGGTSNEAGSDASDDGSADSGG